MSAAASGKPRRSEPGRRGLLRTAIDCFARYGYAGTSIDRIARAAGVTKGALYYHFRDKRQLLFDAVREHVGAFEHVVLEAIQPLADPAAALREIVRICARNARAGTHRRFILTLMVEALDTDAGLSEEFRAMMRRFRAFNRELIRRGQEAGSFRRDLDPSLAARTFVAGILGAEIQFYQDPASIDLELCLEAHAEQFLGWLAVPAASRGPSSGG